MKAPSTALKVTTVSVFTVLIVCFVCYRVGAFDNNLLSENNFDVNAAGMAVDTPVVPKDSLVLDKETVEIMSSSKSMVMPRTYKQDTTKKVSTDTAQKKPLKKKNVMSSSKSGIIYEAEPTPQQNNPPPKH